MPCPEREGQTWRLRAAQRRITKREKNRLLTFIVFISMMMCYKIFKNKCVCVKAAAVIPGFTQSDSSWRRLQAQDVIKKCNYKLV